MEGSFRKALSENSVLILSFFCPFLFALTISEEHPGWGVMAPLWFFGFQDHALTAMPFLPLMYFLYWFPYAYIGYEYRRLVKPELEDPSSFGVRIFVATLLAVVQVLWITYLHIIPGSYITIYIPLPLVSVIALALSRKHVTETMEEPW